MEWLRDKDNAYFAKAFVNRVWSGYFNRGIVEPPDDHSLANPPVNKPLLDHLARGFVESGFDMKWVHREIANSRTYQLSWKPNDTNRGDEANFSHAVPRRIAAEVVYDAIVQATANDETIAKMHQDVSDRAIALPGANGQNRNQNAGPQFALAVFGRSIRESNCDCDRSSEPSLLQTVFLQNDRDMLSLMDRRDGWINALSRDAGRGNVQTGATAQVPANMEQRMDNLERQIKRLKQAGQDAQAKQLENQLAALKRRFAAQESEVEETPAEEPVAKTERAAAVELTKQAYLRTLSRLPDEHELDRSVEFIENSPNAVAGARGLLWALLNTKEFIVNH